MRTGFAIALLLLAGLTSRAQDIEGVHVETYYVTDANDATDTLGVSGGLAEGTRTYRVFIDLCTDCALRGIYGSTCHPLIIQSTAPIFNHADRGRSFGHAINNSWLDEGTVALDSWLSLGAATNQRFGIRKELDDDGSTVGGTNSDGGSAEIAGGLLVNSESAVGIPLTTADGLVPLNGASALPPSFNPTGDDIGPVFGAETSAAEFISDSCRIGCATPGTHGPTDANEILIAQITTNGDLNFEINIEVQRADGSLARYVARDTCLAEDETANGLLRFPPDCGCTDPQFLEYDPAAGCDDGSCLTAIVFGCLDPEACNFDADANFNVPQLCCYGIDDCNGLDPYLVCPGVGIDEPLSSALQAVPNPFSDQLLIYTGVNRGPLQVQLLDAGGRLVHAGTYSPADKDLPITIATAQIPPGCYVLRAIHEREARSIFVLKQ